MGIYCIAFAGNCAGKRVYTVIQCLRGLRYIMESALGADTVFDIPLHNSSQLILIPGCEIYER